MATVNQKINIIVEYFQKNMRGFNTVMSKNQQQFRGITTASGRLNTNLRGMNTMGAKLGHTMRMMTHGTRGFRMELLGIMFFGMMLNRVFMGLMRTSLEWVGINEILSAALGILFLPIALLILDWAIAFLEFVSRLPDGVKMAIGAIVLLGAALGGLLFIVGSIGLGIGSLFVGIGEMAGTNFIGSFAAAMKGFNVMKFLGIGATIISIGWLIHELNKGNIIAAIGAGIAGIGFVTGNPWLIGLGLLITLMGDVDLQRQITKLFLSILDQVIAFGEKIGQMITNIFSGRKWNAGIDLSGFKAGIEEAAPNFQSGFFKSTLPQFANGGVVPGSVGSPMPILAHGGERVTPVHGSSSGAPVVINATYNVNVSDRREFEDMLRANNIKLTEDVRRLTKT